MEDTQNTGAETVESTPSSETPSPAESQSGGSPQDAATMEKPAPFHEHPRFKELIEQNRSYKQELEGHRSSVEQLQAQLQQLMQERQAEQQATKVDPNSKILSRLKEIDPEFASFQELMYKELAESKKAQQELSELREWRQTQETQSQQAQAKAQLSALYEEHKVPESDRAFIESMIKAEAIGNPKLKLSDLPQLFKNVHDNWSKYTSERDRKLRESYVVEKTKDKTPATTTGGAAPSQKPKLPTSTEERINFVRDELRRAKEKV